jgi:protocatechuate 3,4-dioxygenase beta subunit
VSHDDDRPIGRVLSRREILASFGAAAAFATVPGRFLALPGRPRVRLPACVVRPAQTEGPYFVDTRLDRSDIRSDPTNGKVSAGVPLILEFQVSRMDRAGCAPFPGVLVDVWQCDAQGVYSGVKDISNLFDTTGQQFLRGHQRTGADGKATFRTIFPGWYQGRTIHIHFKLRSEPAAERGHEFTSQIYFDDRFGTQVATREPYNSNRQRRTMNAGDGIFGTGGADLLLDLTKDGDGYRGTFDVGMAIG